MKKNIAKEVYVALPALGYTSGPVAAWSHLTVEHRDPSGFRFVQQVAVVKPRETCHWETMVISSRPTEDQAMACLETALKGFLEYRHGQIVSEDPVKEHNRTLAHEATKKGGH